MKFVTIAADGNTLITEGLQGSERVVRQKDKTTVKVLKNLDSATVTFGTKDSSGAFVGYLNGAVDTDSVVNHGARVQLWVNISGYTANAIELGVSE